MPDEKEIKTVAEEGEEKGNLPYGERVLFGEKTEKTHRTQKECKTA